VLSLLVQTRNGYRRCTCTPNRADVFGTGVTLPGCAEESKAVAGLCQLQLRAVLGISGIRLSEYYCIET
jgi:hypothetical protein